MALLAHDAEGEMLQEILENEGIRTMLKRDILGSSFGTQGTSLFVDKTRLEEAQRLYELTLGRGESD